MKKYISILFILCAAYTMPAQSRYTPAAPVGMLQTNAALSTTLQSIKDKSGNTSAMKLSTTAVQIQPPSLTGSSATSALTTTQTWNTTGNPTAIFANITNTASGASANLMDLQVGGVSQFKVDKVGNMSTVGDVSLRSGTLYVGSNFVSSYTQSLGFYGAPATSAISEIRSTTKGFLPPRMTTTQRDAIASPATGLMIYNTTTNRPNFYDGSTWQAL